MKKNTESDSSKKEKIIFCAIVGGFALMGTAAGAGAALSFAGLGLVIWAVARHKHL